MSALESTARSFAWFAAAWPTARKVDDSTIRLWAEGLNGYSGEAIEAAARKWIHTEQRFPNLPAFMEAVRSQQPSVARASNTNLACPVCEGGGWEYLDITGRGTVARCRNGCQPPRMGELSEGGDTSTASPEVVAAMRSTLAKLKPPRGVKRAGPTSAVEIT